MALRRLTGLISRVPSAGLHVSAVQRFINKQPEPMPQSDGIFGSRGLPKKEALIARAAADFLDVSAVTDAEKSAYPPQLFETGIKVNLLPRDAAQTLVGFSPADITAIAAANLDTAVFVAVEGASFTGKRAFPQLSELGKYLFSLIDKAPYLREQQHMVVVAGHPKFGIAFNAVAQQLWSDIARFGLSTTQCTMHEHLASGDLASALAALDEQTAVSLKAGVSAFDATICGGGGNPFAKQNSGKAEATSLEDGGNATASYYIRLAKHLGIPINGSKDYQLLLKAVITTRHKEQTIARQAGQRYFEGFVDHVMEFVAKQQQ